MKTMGMILVVMLAVGIASSNALEIGGIVMPDTLDVGKGELILNGAGILRKFGIKIYAGGLYLIENNANPEEIISADEFMAIRMHMIYNGHQSGNTWVKSWTRDFNDANENISFLEDKIEKYCSFYEPGLDKDDVIDIVYAPGEGTKLIKNGELLLVTEGLEFKKALFSIWLGDYQRVVESLKKDFLGIK